MSYRNDSDALVARNVALERQVKELEQRAPAAPRVIPTDVIARGTASVAGVVGGTYAAIAAAANYFSADYIWMGCAVAGISLFAPFIRLNGPLRPFTLRTTYQVACADGPGAVTLIAVVHFSPDRADRARRTKLFGERTAAAKRIAQDLIEGVLREQLGTISSSSIRTDAAAVSAQIQEASGRALAGYGLTVDRLFVSSIHG